VPYRNLGDDLIIYQFENLLGRPKEVEHFVSTRLGGVSDGRYASLNFSFRTGDEPERVVTNRSRLFNALEIDPSGVVAGKQVHETKVRRVTAEHRGRGATDYESALDDTDALITDEPGLCLMVLAADCVPVLLYDPQHSAIGAAHAGWRGTVAHIAQRTVEAMVDAFGTNPSDLIAGVGPSIGPEDYEVGPEVIEQVQAAFPGAWEQQVRALPNGKGIFDLWTSNRLQLEASGIPSGQIEVSAISSFQATDRFFSERREGRPTGRFAAGLVLTTNH
jgi:polyphenol oxidase